MPFSPLYLKGAAAPVGDAVGVVVVVVVVVVVGVVVERVDLLIFEVVQ
jgi:hypothetical protein